MKKIEAIIKPFTIDGVRTELERVGITGVTICEVAGYGRRHSEDGLNGGADVRFGFKPKVKLEIVVRDDQAEAVVEAIQRKARTGRTGDGKILILPVAEAVRIRTHEHGDTAV